MKKTIVIGAAVFSAIIWLVHGYIERFLFVRNMFTVFLALLPGAIFLFYSLKLKKKNEELRRSKEEKENIIKELQKKNEEIGSYAYAVYHDLKSPIFSMKGWARRLRKKLGKIAELDPIKPYLDTIQQLLDRSEAFLSNLLTLSRLENVTPIMERVSLKEIIEKALLSTSILIVAKGVKIKVDYERLPVVCADIHMLCQLFENLIGNAGKFMGDQAEPEIEIGIAIEDGEKTIFVKDNGMGISSQQKDKIFDMFETIDKTNGTGIGLAICKLIVEAHGGKIWAKSEGLGKGSTFYFTLGGEKK